MRAARLAERVTATAVLMVGIAVFIFLTMRLLPGDPVDLILGQGGHVTAQQEQALRSSYHLDEPVPLQLVTFLSGLAHGDLGESVVYNKPVTQVILDHLPATVELALAAILFALMVSVPVGVLSAVRRGSLVDRFSMAGSFLGVSLPGFWLGIVLIMLFSVRLHSLPVEGRITPGLAPIGHTGLFTVDALVNLDFESFWSALTHLVLPGITMGAVMMAILARVIRSSMVEELQRDYVVFARSKGAGEARVVVRHALRNALIPAVTVFGLEVGALLGGNMIVETVFGWPGIGRLAVSAIFARDYPLVQGIVILYAFTFAVANLLVDLAYTWLNPRVSL